MRISDWSSDVCSSDLVDREKPAIIEWLAIGVVSEVFTGHGETAKGYPSVILDSIQTQITPCFQPLDQLQEPPADLLRGERRVVGWRGGYRSEEDTSELQSLIRISYAVFCLKKKTKQQ